MDQTSFRDTPGRGIAYLLVVTVLGFVGFLTALSVVVVLEEEFGEVTGDLARVTLRLADTH